MAVPNTLAELSTTHSGNTGFIDGATDSVSVLDDHMRAAYAFTAQNRDAISGHTTAIGTATTDIATVNSKLANMNQPGAEITAATDWNTLTTPGAYRASSTSFGSNSPSNVNQSGMLMVWKDSNQDICQVYAPNSDEILRSRTYRNGGSWSAWSDVGSIFRSGARATRSIELGDDFTGDRDVWIDFHADDTTTDYGMRIIRGPGANGSCVIGNRGTGGAYIDASHHVFRTVGGVELWRVDGAGRLINTGANMPNFYATTSASLGDSVIATSYAAVDQQGSAFSASTGIYTAPVSGWYTFSALALVSGGNAIRRFYIRRRRGGAAIDIAEGVFSTYGEDYSRRQNIGISRIKLVAGDEVYVYASTGDGGDDKITVLNFSGGLVA